jgi:hypothetical protein
MPEEPRLLEEYREFVQEKQSAANGGRISTVEGGLRADIFDHDENSEYDFSEHDCMICEIPEHAQNHIIEDMEYEEGNA